MSAEGELSGPWMVTVLDPSIQPSRIIDEVRAERQRAHDKHGETSVEHRESFGVLLPQGDREAAVDLAALRKELIQVAAMAAAWADAIPVSS
jgi:hypothetical protein